MTVTSVPRRMGLATTIVRGFAEGGALDARHAVRTRSARRRGHYASGVPVTHGDPLSRQVLDDPDAWFRSLHASGPVNYCPRRNIWIINGYDEVHAAARAHESLSSAEGTARFRTRLPMMLTMDRPQHARLRRILARDFTKERVEANARAVLELTERRVSEVLRAGDPVDAHPAIAGPIPLETISAILGIPSSDRAALRRWSDSATTAFTFEVSPAGLRVLARFLVDLTEMFDYFEHVIESRREAPGNDAISRLVSYEDDDGSLSTDELLWFALVLLVAGNETTTSVMMALLYCLAHDPDQLDALRADPTLVPAAIEEGVRWASPVPAFFRTARRPYEVAGNTIPEGSRVMLGFAAANRDPRRFSTPERFDVTRPATDHVGFGSGIHFCLGSHLARVELRVLLETIVASVKRVEPTGAAVWRRNPSLRGLESLPIRLHAVESARSCQ